MFHLARKLGLNDVLLMQLQVILKQQPKKLSKVLAKSALIQLNYYVFVLNDEKTTSFNTGTENTVITILFSILGKNKNCSMNLLKEVVDYESSSYWMWCHCK